MNPMSSAPLPGFPRLLGDVGGTNARFALQEIPGGLPTRFRSYRCADHASLEDTLRRYLADEGRPQVTQAAIGIANPVQGDDIRMTNHHWRFSIAHLRDRLALERLLVLNDFTALALALPGLRPSELAQVGGGQAIDGRPIGLLGPGTGLGVSGLFPAAPGQRPTAIEGEGGHVTLAAATHEESAVLELLRERFGHVSAERVLSGPGLVNLYQAVCRLRGSTAGDLSAADISNLGSTQGDPACAQTLLLFFSFLGNVAGNLALTLGTRGGVYIGGGIAPRLKHLMPHTPFRERFEDKGRFRSYLADIPTFLVDALHPPALTGAARALDQS